MKPHLLPIRNSLLALLATGAVILLTGTASAQNYRGRAANAFQPYGWSSPWALTPPAITYGQLVNARQFQTNVQRWNVRHNKWYAGQYGNPVFGPIPGVHGSYAFPYVYGYGYGHGYARPYMRQVPHFPRLFRRHR